MADFQPVRTEDIVPGASPPPRVRLQCRYVIVSFFSDHRFIQTKIKSIMNKYEQFTYDQIQPQLASDETVQITAFLFNKSLVGMALFGALATLGGGYFLTAATDRRLFLVKTKMGFWSLKRENHGIIEIPYTDVVGVEPGGAMNQKTVTISTKDGSALKLRLNTLAKFMTGQKQFIEQLPQLVEKWKKVSSN
jgi:hypothetical protein